MKIAVFLEHFPPYMGADLRIFELTRRLTKRNHEICYVVLPSILSLFGFKRVEQGKNREKKELQKHNFIEILPPKWLNFLWRRMITVPLAYVITVSICVVSTIKQLKGLKIDRVIICKPSPLVGVVGLLYAEISRKKILLDIPDLEILYAFETLNKVGKLFFFASSFLEANLIKKANLITVTTSSIKSYVLNMKQRAKVKVIPNGVDINSFNPKKYKTKKDSKSHAFRVLFVGRIEKWSGVDLLIHSAKIVKKEHSNKKIIFLIVGDGFFHECCRDLANKLGLEEIMQFTGYIKKAHIPSIIAQSDVTVVPFRKSLMTDASLPIKLFEYMAMGKTVIASSLKGIQEIIKPDVTGILIEPENVGALAHKIIWSYDNVDLIRQIGERACTLMREKHSWNSLSYELHNYISSH